MAAVIPDDSAGAAAASAAPNDGVLTLLPQAQVDNTDVVTAVCNAPNKVLLSAGITSADMCRINHEGRLAIEKTVERQNSARTKVSEEFKERHAGIERLRKEMVDCKVPSLGGHMPFLVLDLPLQATNPHIRTGEKKGVCHHWVVDPNHLIDASKAEHELNLRLTEMDVSIKKNDDEIKAVQKDLRKLNTEISNKSGHDRKCTSGRIRRATASLTKLKAIKERLTEYKAAMQAAVDHTNTKGVGCAKWTWVTADDILDSISGSNDIHPKYTVASHTGIYVDGNFKRHEAQGTRLCAVASLALADNPYDASHQTQHVVVSVTLMTYIGKLWYYAVQSDDNPPGRVMTIEKRAWAEEGGLAKVAEQAEDGLNRTLGLMLAQLAFSSTTHDVGRKFEGTSRPNVWTYWNSIGHTDEYLLGEEYNDPAKLTAPPLAYDTTEGTRPQAQFKLLFIEKPPPEAGLYSLIRFLCAKSHYVEDKPDLTWCETLFQYEATDKDDIVERSRYAVVSCATALYLAYSIATDPSVASSTKEAVAARSYNRQPENKDDRTIGEFISNLGPQALPPAAQVRWHADGAETEEQAQEDEGEAAVVDQSVSDDDEDEDEDEDGDQEEDELFAVDTAERVKDQQKEIRKATCQNLFQWLRRRRSPHFATLDAVVLSGERNEMAAAYVSSLRNTTEFSAAMTVHELKFMLAHLWRVSSRQAKKLTEQQNTAIKLITAVVKSGIYVEVEKTQYKVELMMKGESDPRIELLDDNNQPCGAPPKIKYFNENLAPVQTAITKPALNLPNGSFHVALLEYLQSSGIKVQVRLQATNGGVAAAAAPLPAPVVDEEALRAEYAAKVNELQQRLAEKEVAFAAVQKKAKYDLNKAAANETVAKDAIYLARAQELLALATNIDQDEASESDPGLALFKLLEMHLGSKNVPAAVSATAPVSAVMRVATIMKRSDSMTPAEACQHIACAVAGVYEPMGESSTVLFKAYKLNKQKVVEKKNYKMTALTATFFFLLFPEIFVDLFMPLQLGVKDKRVSQNIKILRGKCFVRPKNSKYETLEDWTVLDRRGNPVQVLVSVHGKKNLNAKYLLGGLTLPQFVAEPSGVNDAMQLPELTIFDDVEPTRGLKELDQTAAAAGDADEEGDNCDEGDKGEENEDEQPKRRVSTRAAAAAGVEDEDDNDTDEPLAKRANLRSAK